MSDELSSEEEVEPYRLSASERHSAPDGVMPAPVLRNRNLQSAQSPASPWVELKRLHFPAALQLKLQLQSYHFIYQRPISNSRVAELAGKLHCLSHFK